MKKNNFETILGYPITTLGKGACSKKILEWIKSGEKGEYLVCANPHSLEVAKRDKIFAKALRKADILVPDGVGIILASKILGGKIRGRVTGTDIFLGLNEALNKEPGYSCFFLGSKEKNLGFIKDKMRLDFPNVEIAGTYSPPFKPEFSDGDNEAMLNAINAVNPDVLWVGMTAPKQEKWIYTNRKKLDVNFIGAIGAVFDFYVGTVERSHPYFQKHGLEWLPRLMRQPGRLWKRTVVSAPGFLMRVLAQRLSHNKDHGI